jgi:hypothetical protein
VAVDVIHQALGTARMSDGEKSAIEIGSDGPNADRNSLMLRVFGRGERNSICDCDRQKGPSLRQSLFTMSDGPLMEAIQEGQLLREILVVESPEKAVELLFLSVLSRPPTDAEATVAAEHVTNSDNAEAAWVDVIWALVNAREFLTNH